MNDIPNNKTLIQANGRAQPSELLAEDAELILKAWFLADKDHSSVWRQQCRDDFTFYAGNQWNPVDKAKLDDQKRPTIVFNQVLPVIQAVCGMEVNSRRQVAYYPRGGTEGPDGTIKVAMNELLTGAAKWMSDEADASIEQSEAFKATTICGMGWTEPSIQYDSEPDGRYHEPEIDPIEMYWDCFAGSKNLRDARRLARARRVSLDDALSLFPDAHPDDLDATWADLGDMAQAKPVEERMKKLSDGRGIYTDPQTQVTIIHMQWIETEHYYRVVHPQSGEPVDVPVAKFGELQALAQELQTELVFTKQSRKVYKQGWLGNKLLKPISACPAVDQFSWQCITGERDRIRKTWFGLISLMRDPQLWTNKLFSQTLHILNTTAKGGVIMEKGAVEGNLEDFQDTYASPDAVTIVADDAIAKGKVMQKPGGGEIGGYVQLLMFTREMVRASTGINLEVMGMREANQPIGLEVQRKQAAMTILATLFDAFRYFQKQIGRVRLTFIQRYLSTGQLIELSSPQGMVLVPLVRDQVAGRYKVVIDDSPTSANEMEAAWESIKGSWPLISQVVTPESLSLIMDYMPIPVQLRTSLKQLLASPNPQTAQAAEVAMAAAMARIAKDQGSAALAQAQVTTEQTKALENLSDINENTARADYDRAKASLLRSIHPARPQIPLLSRRLPPAPAELPLPPVYQPTPGPAGDGTAGPGVGGTDPVEMAAALSQAAAVER